MRKIVLLISIFALSSCVSVGTAFYDSWKCSQISGTEDYSCNVLSDTYLSNLNTPLNGLTYIGPVKDYGNTLQPHGWGKFLFQDESFSYKIEFSYGKPKEADIRFANGNTFKGEINQQLTWISGISVTDEVIFKGTFYYVDNGYRYKEGKAEYQNYSFEGTFYKEKINVPKIGKFVSKTDNLTFDGSFNQESKFQKGTLIDKYYEEDKQCKRIFNGYIDNNESGWLYNLRSDFTLEQPAGTINKKNGDLSVVLIERSKPFNVYYSDESDALISSKNLVKFDDTFGDFASTSFTWPNFLNCFSSPIYTKKEIILDGDNERYSVIEGIGPTDGVYAYGFENWNINNLDKLDGQLFLVKFKTKDSSRTITDVFTEDSKYISGRREVFNPKYDEVSLEVDKAYLAWQDALRNEFKCTREESNANPMTCAVLQTTSRTKTKNAEESYYAVRGELSRTKRTILEDIYSSYEVEKLKITASQNATLVAAIIDFRNGKIFEKEYSLNDSKKFVVINSPVADTDPDKNRIQRNSSKESEVDKWMQNQILLSKSAKTVFDELLQTKPKKKSKRELRSYVDNLVNASSNDSRGKRIATSYRKKNSYELEDSIMVVSNLQGSGTAFYINNNYLITNQHVVEESNFVTLRNQEGDSFTAEVIDTDIATDLALVKSNTEGIPLNIHPTCDIKRREDVFTIGHPVGYEYSTTRGIISAIRTIPNPFYKATGLKKYIQIDAPISPGNSGGPLFNSASEVVGVNTWGDNQGQNLNFAVHCSELKEFLDSNYINY